jgi:hypothetical protein
MNSYGQDGPGYVPGQACFRVIIIPWLVGWLVLCSVGSKVMKGSDRNVEVFITNVKIGWNFTSTPRHRSYMT